MQNYAVRLSAEGAEAFEAAFKRAGKTGEDAMRRIGTGARESGAQLRGVSDGFARAGGAGIQNVAFQVGDFATQVGAGTRASTALAQQLPQLLGGFGPLGAVLGAVVAIAVPLGAAFLTMGDNAGTLEDRQKALEAAITDVDAATRLSSSSIAEITRLYGGWTDEVQGLIAAKAQLAKDSAAEAAQSLISGSFTDFTDRSLFPSGGAEVKDLTSGAAELVSQLEVGEAAAMRLQDAIVDARGVRGLEQQADALARIRDLFDEARDAQGRLPPEAAKLYQQVVDTEDMIRRAVGSTEALEGAMSGASAMAAGLATQAMRAADEIARAASNAMTLAAQGRNSLQESEVRLQHKGDPVGQAGALAGLEFRARVGDYSGADPILRQAIDQQRDAYVENAKAIAQNQKSLADWNAEQRKAASAASAASRAGQREAERDIKAYDRLIDASHRRAGGLQEEIDGADLTGAALARLQEKNRLLADAQRANLDLTPKQVEELDQLAAAYGRTSEAVDAMKRAQEAGQEFSDTVREGFRGLALGAESFSEAASRALDRFATRLFDMATDPIFDALSNQFASLFAGGGGGGGNFLSDTLGTFIGRRAGGGPVAAGRPYWVGDGGEPELFVPNRAGTIVPRSAMGGGAQEVHVTVGVEVARDGNLRAFVKDVSRSTTAEGIGHYDATIPDRVRSVVSKSRYKG